MKHNSKVYIKLVLHVHRKMCWTRDMESGDSPLGEIPLILVTFRRCASKSRLAFIGFIFEKTLPNLLNAIVLFIPFKITLHSSESVNKYKSYMHNKKGTLYPMLASFLHNCLTKSP